MIDMHVVDDYVVLLTMPETKPTTLPDVWGMLGPIRHLIVKDARYLIVIQSAVIATDPGHIIKEIFGGPPTLTVLEIDSFARRILRTQNYRDFDSVTGRLSKPDMWMVNGRIAELGDGLKTNSVVPFVLKELS
jgi:hypothetical protein